MVKAAFEGARKYNGVSLTGMTQSDGLFNELRLDKDTHDLLKQRLEDLGRVSFADFVKDSLELLQLKIPDIEKIKDEARGEGYDEAEKEFQIWYYCAVCRERIDMMPDSDSHKAMIGYMKEHGWGHPSCHRQ